MIGQAQYIKKCPCYFEVYIELIYLKKISQPMLVGVVILSYRSGLLDVFD